MPIIMILKDKVSVVTGGARGIGKAVALRFAKEGSDIAICDINAEVLESSKKDIEATGRTVITEKVDVTNLEEVKKFVQKVLDKFGKINILINNAGITRDNLMMRMSRQEWDQVIATNLTAIFSLSNLCIRDMIKARWGRIVNISSVVGCMGNAGQANYAASKAGVIGFSKSLAIEVAARNITVNCVAPGFIETDMTKKLSDEQREKLLAVVPMKRIGQPEDVANSVGFLVSEDASYVTGVTIHVNGEIGRAHV